MRDPWQTSEATLKEPSTNASTRVPVAAARRSVNRRIALARGYGSARPRSLAAWVAARSPTAEPRRCWDEVDDGGAFGVSTHLIPMPAKMKDPPNSGMLLWVVANPR
jgi:hypothetical protein